MTQASDWSIQDVNYRKEANQADDWRDDPFPRTQFGAAEPKGGRQENDCNDRLRRTELLSRPTTPRHCRPGDGPSLVFASGQRTEFVSRS